MKIGTVTVKNMGESEVVFTEGINGFTTGNGRIRMQLEGNYKTKLPLSRKKVYDLTVVIDNNETLTFRAMFEDYNFSAGYSSYVDGEGKFHEGTVVTNNNLQFIDIG